MSNEVQLDTTWDPVKAQSNVAKHGVTFVQAATVLLDALALTTFDSAHNETDERWFTLGNSSDGKLLAVSHTYQHTGPIHVSVRIISAREATKRERQQYENEPR
ncbi:BrnT family toxin [Rhodoferax sp.]|uniref:BrnT family toxin n=1 Tax=Rhodoferax sp. TaxID=50421 RepID=UPI0027596270|nr:BrnT family toxin [Rhodoferax sp.]